MRIAYVAPYQGPTLMERRPVVRNLSLSNRVKIEMVAQMLRDHGHDVVLISQGEVVEHDFVLHRAFSEPQRFCPTIPVEYASALPVRRLNGAWSSGSTLRLFNRLANEKPFDLVIVFNLKWPQLAVALQAQQRLRMPVVLQYEDDAFVSVHGERGSSVSSWLHLKACQRVLPRLSGCTAVSPHLMAQLPTGIPRMLLRGVVGDDVCEMSRATRGKKQNWVVFAGTHIESNGVGELIAAWKASPPPGWELHITGRGHLTALLEESAAGVPSIVFHGLVERPELVRLLTGAKICINPHSVAAQSGIVFAFKIIEYLAAGAHVITTPMGFLEADLDKGVTYLDDNAAHTVAQTLNDVIATGRYESTAACAAQASYGRGAAAGALDRLVNDAVAACRR